MYANTWPTGRDSSALGTRAFIRPTLYMSEEMKKRQNEFDEGDEWVTQGPLEDHDAFNRFGTEASWDSRASTPP